MNRKETIATFALISSLFPRDDKFANATKEMISAWNEMLADIPFDTVKAAIKAAVATSPFPPSICEIRNYAVKITENSFRSPEEAWKIACDTMRKYGCSRYMNYTTGMTDYDRAKKNCPEDVWKVMELMGYRDMCMSENKDVLRGQFMKIWKNQADREHEYRVVGPVVPQLVEKVAQNLLVGGENGEDV